MDSQEVFVKRKKKYYLTDEIFDSINNRFYNLGGVVSDFESCINFIFNYYLCSQNKLEIETIEKSSYDECITFECVYSINQLFFPLLFHDLMCEEKVSDNEIQIFLNYLLINHRENKILDLIFLIFYIKDIPQEIIINI
jgi:hypothetical protein